ncbi:MAG TPA: BTAD domain-containing putative transcriptional regulator [Streptosporangiaceae bacterium]
MPDLRFQVLGPVRAWRRDGDRETELDLGPAKQRAVFGVLALGAGAAVSREAIIEFLWPDEPPPTAVNAVQTYIKRLRQALEPDRPPREASRFLPAVHGGYLLSAPGDQLDLVRFRSMIGSAREAEQNEEWDKAAELRHGALDLWRDRPLADLGPLIRLHPKVTALEQERLGAALDYFDTELAAGRAGAVLPRIEEMAGGQPLHEPMQARLVRAYHACGRHAEALAVFGRVRERLRDELGVDPGSELRRAYEQVLRAGEPSAAPRGRWHGPRPITDLVGRADDVDRLCELVVTRRLITLCGPGGAGKTALATVVARRVRDGFPAGVGVIELGALPAEPEGGSDGDGALVAGAVATGLGIRVGDRKATVTAVARALQGRELLIVLDNAEHVVRGCAALVDHLARTSPSVTLVVTSRRPLGVAGETVWDVAPLPVPPVDGDGDELRSYPSVELFLRRVADACPGLDLDDQITLVGRLCRRLDGLPLAIELAAARLRSMSLSDLDIRLTRQPSVLSGGDTSRLPHQRALETTIEWSRRLLSPWQRLLLGRLSVLTGSFTLDTAERVCGFPPLSADEVAPLLADLAESSLVHPVRDRQYRYRLLAPIREFALGRIDPAELRATRGRHLAWCVSLARATEMASAGERAGRVVAAQAEIDDIFAALAWAFDPASDSERRQMGARLLAANRAVWDADPHNLDIVWHWTRRALEYRDDLPRDLQARLLHWAGRITWVTGHPAMCRAYLESAYDEYDPEDPEERRHRVDVQIGLAAVADRLGDPDAVQLARAVIAAARDLGDTGMLAKALADMGCLLAEWGHMDEGRTALRQARRVAGESALSLRSCDYREATLRIREGRAEESLAASDRVLDVGAGLSPTLLVDLLTYRGWAYLRLGRPESAREALAQALEEMRKSNRQIGVAHPLHALAYLEHQAGRPEMAASHLRGCLEGCLHATDRLTAVHAITLAAAIAADEKTADAPRLVALARHCRTHIGVPLWPFTDDEAASWPDSGDPELPDGVGDDTAELVTYAVEEVLTSLDRALV